MLGIWLKMALGLGGGVVNCGCLGVVDDDSGGCVGGTCGNGGLLVLMSLLMLVVCCGGGGGGGGGGGRPSGAPLGMTPPPVGVKCPQEPAFSGHACLHVCQCCVASVS